MRLALASSRDESPSVGQSEGADSVRGDVNPIGWAKAVGKIIDMGAAMDAEAVKLGCEAHHAALQDPW